MSRFGTSSIRLRRTSLAVVAGLALLSGLAALTPSASASSTFELVNYNSGKCLDNHSSTSSGTQMIQWTCWGGSSQLWTIWYQNNEGGGQWYVFQNAYSGLCLDVWQAASTTNGQPIVQYPCNANDSAQTFWRYWDATCSNRWQLSAVDGRFAPTNYMVEVYGSSQSNGGTVDIWSSNNSQTQYWCVH